MKVKFAKNVGPMVEIGHAGYRRVFIAEGEPFEVSQHEWDNHLARSEKFEIVPEENAAEEEPPAAMTATFGNLAQTEEVPESES